VPEGDTIFRSARTLDRALRDAVITRFESVLAPLARMDDEASIAGRTVLQVEARGKWLLMHLSGDLILVTHMLMSGSWHIYRTGERWHAPRRDMRIVIATERFEAVAFRVQVARFYTARTLARDSAIPKLGPDLLKPDFAADEARERLLALGEEEIGNALLNQRVMAGIGNVYKSEVLFACGVFPFRRVATLAAAEIDCILERARSFLAMNVKEATGGEIVTYTGLRRTTHSGDPGGRLWVYRRRGEACRRCGTAIQMRRQGLGARSTYWCPECQPEP